MGREKNKSSHEKYSFHRTGHESNHHGHLEARDFLYPFSPPISLFFPKHIAKKLPPF
jgi:hypothetical protein